MKAKCANCGKEMTQEHSPNWKMYCVDEPCKKAMMDSVLKGGKP